MKRIIASVTNDLAGEQRVHRICLTLAEMGFDVLLTGRKLPSSSSIPARSYSTRRMKLIFRKGPLFYAEYNFRLLLFLLLHRFDVLLSNDLDTLPANFLASRLKRKPLVYDSHEYFTEVPELVDRPRVQKIWGWIERKMVPRVNAAYTVCHSIAEVYTKKYGIPFEVVRNLPFPLAFDEPQEEKQDKETQTIIYQGALNTARGLEQAIRAMQFLPDIKLLLAGGGGTEQELKKLVTDLKLRNVHFTGRLPLEELHQLTRRAQLGISIEEDKGLNYRYALPNKLFDYIQARIPVIVSDLPEMSQIVRQYQIGLVTPTLEPQALAGTFIKALTDQTLKKEWAENLEKAAGELTWEKEENKIRAIFGRYLV